MSGSSGSRTTLLQRALVSLQVFLLVATMVTPVAALAYEPSDEPSAPPSAEPTAEPSAAPTAEATAEPTTEPIAEPTAEPTSAAEPSPEPDPTTEPSAEPSVGPTPAPTAEPSAPEPTIVSDLDDYPPGGLVTLTGEHWLPGETVSIYVNDHVGETWSRRVDVVADASGTIFDQFILPDWFVADYSVFAIGDVSGVTTTTFTDSNPSSVGVGAPITASVPQGSTAVYGALTVTATGSAGACNTTLSVDPAFGTGLPVGASPVFGVNPVQTTGSDATTSFSVATTAATPVGIYTFRITGVDSVPPSGGACQGGAGNTPSASLTLTVTAGSRTTSTAVASGSIPSASLYGDLVTFTATVTAAAGNPSGVGTVTFRDGTTTICAAVPLSTNTASCAISSLTVSPHSIAAEYSGGTSGAIVFLGSTSAALSHTISQAPTTTVVTCPTTVVYSGLPQTPCTVSVTGANLNLTPPAVHATNTNVGTASASYTYAGDENHSGSSGSDTFEITQAAPDCIIVGTTVTYDGDPHGASGSCVGVLGEALVGHDLGSTFTHVPGGTATWTFTDITGNYTDATGTAAILIGAKLLTVTAADQTKTYGDTVLFAGIEFSTDGLVNGDTVMSVSLTSTGAAFSAGVAGSPYAIVASAAVGTGLDNYTITYVDGNVVIDAATLVVTPDAQAVTYGDAAPAYTFSVTGFVNSETAATAAGYAAPSCTSDYTATTPVADGPRTISCAAGLADNYVFDTSATDLLAITKAATSTVVSCPVSVVYTGSPIAPCTVLITGAGGLNLTPTPSYTSNVLVGTVTASYTYAESANHLGSSGSATFEITTAFRIVGFDSPVDMTTGTRIYNSVKGGQTVPLKFRVFNLDGTEVTSTAGIKAWYKSVTCASGTVDPALIEADSTASKGLMRTGDRFHYNWAVPKGAGKCYQVLIQTVDGSTAMVRSLTDTTPTTAFFTSK